MIVSRLDVSTFVEETKYMWLTTLNEIIKSIFVCDIDKKRGAIYFCGNAMYINIVFWAYKVKAWYKSSTQETRYIIVKVKATFSSMKLST